MDLHREVLAPAEGAADPAQVEAGQLEREPQAGGHLALVNVQPLGGDVEVDAAVLGRDRERRLRPEEGLVLHAHLVVAAHHHLGLGVRVAVADRHAAQQVAARVEGPRAVGQGGIDAS